MTLEVTAKLQSWLWCCEYLVQDANLIVDRRLYETRTPRLKFSSRDLWTVNHSLSLNILPLLMEDEIYIMSLCLFVILHSGTLWKLIVTISRNMESLSLIYEKPRKLQIVARNPRTLSTKSEITSFGSSVRLWEAPSITPEWSSSILPAPLWGTNGQQSRLSICGIWFMYRSWNQTRLNKYEWSYTTKLRNSFNTNQRGTLLTV